MIVISVNTSIQKKIIFNNKEEYTGYFKAPINEPIYLGKTDVLGDVVVDRKHHGGLEKACYIYGYNHYAFWKEKYPRIEWQYGMFGENITIEHLDENKLFIGDVLQIGNATVQITQPRQPCYKMGIKFNDQKIVQEFRSANCPGIYVRVLKEGYVSKNDKLIVTDSPDKSISVNAIYSLLYSTNPNKKFVDIAKAHPFLAKNVIGYLENKFK